MPVRLLDEVEARNPVDGDDQLRLGEPQPHQRAQALAGGEALGLGAPVGEWGEGLRERRGGCIVQARREDRAPLLWLVNLPRTQRTPAAGVGPPVRCRALDVRVLHGVYSLFEGCSSTRSKK